MKNLLQGFAAGGEARGLDEDMGSAGCSRPLLATGTSACLVDEFSRCICTLMNLWMDCNSLVMV